MGATRYNVDVTGDLSRFAGSLNDEHLGEMFTVPYAALQRPLTEWPVQHLRALIVALRVAGQELGAVPEPDRFAADILAESLANELTDHLRVNQI